MAQLYPKNRKYEVRLCSIRIGHKYWTHKFLLSRDDPPQFKNCRESPTVLHITCTCLLLKRLRRRHFPQLHQQQIPIYTALLPGEDSLVFFSTLFRFLKQSDFLHFFSSHLSQFLMFRNTTSWRVIVLAHDGLCRLCATKPPRNKM